MIKNILGIVLFLFIFPSIILAKDISTKEIILNSLNNSYIFALNRDHKILLIYKTSKNNFPISYFEPWANPYLKDSFISDPIFRKKCNGIWPGEKFSTDPFDPSFSHKTTVHKAVNRPLYSYDGMVFGRSNFKTPEILVHQFLGYKVPFSFLTSWEYIEKEFSQKKRTLMLYPEYPCAFFSSDIPGEEIYTNSLRDGKFLEINDLCYRSINKDSLFNKNYFKVKNNVLQNLTDAERAFFESLMKESSIEIRKLSHSNRYPIMCIDPNNHSKRMDKNDWVVECFLNKNNGDFFEYFFFEKELEYVFPFYLRDWALDHLAGVNQCRKSTVGIILNSKEKVVVQTPDKSFNPRKILFSLNEQNKPWCPNPVPTDKNEIPTERLFYKDIPGRIYGSTEKIWDLGIWERLGMMFKLNPKAEIYLCGYGTLLQAAETKTAEEEHALIKKCGVLMTSELYSELEKLRKSTK